MTTEAPPRAAGRLLYGWLAVATLVLIGTGMAYTIWWPDLVRHTPYYWLYPGDIWATVRTSHWIGWGSFSYVYSSRTALVTLPGFAVLFTPVVVLGSHLNLIETAPGLIPVPKPTDWLLIGPVIMACGAVALAGFDAVARTLGAGAGRRRLLIVVEMAALWPTVVIWGHPEDVLALGLLALALDRALRDRQVSAAWLLGGALCMQLYAIAAVPIFLGLVGRKKAPALALRAAILPAVLFLAVVIPNPHATIHALIDQPNFPRIDFPTPWVLVAPHLARHTVAAGIGRLIGLAGDAALGLVAARWRRDPVSVAWLCGAALSLRCLFESVMDPYYVAPAIAFFLAALVLSDWVRWTVAAMLGAGLVDLVYFRTGIWWYWVEMAAAFSLLGLVTLPPERFAGLVRSVRPLKGSGASDPPVEPAMAYPTPSGATAASVHTSETASHSLL